MGRNAPDFSSHDQDSYQNFPRSLSDIDRSTAAKDPRPSASCSARKNPQCIPANTPPVFPGLRPRIWSHLLRLVTKAMSDRLLKQAGIAKQEEIVQLTAIRRGSRRRWRSELRRGRAVFYERRFIAMEPLFLSLLLHSRGSTSPRGHARDA